MDIFFFFLNWVSDFIFLGISGISFCFSFILFIIAPAVFEYLKKIKEIHDVGIFLEYFRVLIENDLAKMRRGGYSVKKITLKNLQV